MTDPDPRGTKNDLPTILRIAASLQMPFQAPGKSENVIRNRPVGGRTRRSVWFDLRFRIPKNLIRNPGMEEGITEIEGKATTVGVSECGEPASFKRGTADEDCR